VHVGVFEKDDKIYIVLDGEDNVILQSDPAIGAIVIDRSILDNPKYSVVVTNHYADYIGRDLMRKIRQGIAEGRHIKDVIFEDHPSQPKHWRAHSGS